MTDNEWLCVATADSRALEVVVVGPPDGFPLVYHSGTPSAAAAFPALSRAAGVCGLRTVTYSRPGYGESTEQPGRSVADVTADVSAVLAALGMEQFVTLGWSGGGPHALACAALMPDACRAVATLASVAPRDARSLDWLAGMGEDNVGEFGAAAAGAEPLTAYLSAQRPGLAGVTATEVAAALGDLVSEVDTAAITGEFADYLAETFRRAVLNGISGWRDDDLALMRGWGFDVAAIEVPVAVWQGGNDRMVPYEHGAWLAANIPGAHAHLDDSEGHLSLMASLPHVLADLTQLAGLA